LKNQIEILEKKSTITQVKKHNWKPYQENRTGN
jgi:hypothetical protein